MRAFAIPTPSWSSEPSSSTRGQKGLPVTSTVDRSPCFTSTLSPHISLATNPSAQPIMPSLAAAILGCEHPSFILLSRSTHTPVFPVIEPSSMSMSNAEATPDEMLRKVISSLSVRTVS